MNIYISIICYCLLVLISCSQKHPDSKIKKVAKLSKKLKEASGIEKFTASDDLWMINDSGNKNQLYKISEKGKIIQVITVKSSKNKDWEDLSTDHQSKLFIGDFGNNANSRKDLGIYSVNIHNIKNNEVQAEKISFEFEDQKKFPPKRKDRNFDIEAFFYYQDFFYLFTKNRSSDFDGTTKLYKLPATLGHHKARYISSFKTCKYQYKCWITAADISKDGKEVVLLSHDRIFKLTDFSGDDFFSGSVKKIKLHHNSQKESICFDGNQTLWLSDERTKKGTGNLYKLILD